MLLAGLGIILVPSNPSFMLGVSIYVSREALIFFVRFLFLEKEGRKRRRETSICDRYMDRLLLPHSQLGTWPATQACAPTGNRTGSNLLVCRPVLNPLSHTSQGKRDISFSADSSFWEEGGRRVGELGEVRCGNTAREGPLGDNQCGLAWLQSSGRVSINTSCHPFSCPQHILP